MRQDPCFEAWKAVQPPIGCACLRKVVGFLYIFRHRSSQAVRNALKIFMLEFWHINCTT
jgi:hypothetical protein